MRGGMLAILVAAVLTSTTVTAQTLRIDVFFDNDAVGADYRDASWGTASGGDFLRLIDGSKMPVEAGAAYRGATSGVLEYRHAGGSFDLFVAAEGWPTFDFTLVDSLVMYLNGPASIAAGELPRVGIEDGNKVRSGTVVLGDYIGSIDGDPATWQRVAIPLTDISYPAGFSMDMVQTVRFASGGMNPATRTLWIDDIHGVGDASHLEPPSAPHGLETRVGDRSVILHWTAPGDVVAGYRVYRSEADGGYVHLGAPTQRPVYVDVSVENDRDYSYHVRSVDGYGLESQPSETVSAHPRTLDDPDFIELVQRTAFDFFWREAHPVTGHVRDRDRPDAACSIAATGMGLSAVTVGIDRGWITRSEGRQRIHRTLQRLWDASQGAATTGQSGYRGFFYHFVNCATGLRAGTSELSTIDTALLMAGVLHVGEYFDLEDAVDAEIRTLADNLYRRVEWTWAQPRAPRIGHGWHPESGYIPHDYRGYDEAMILYLLALGSPTHPVISISWQAYTSTYSWGHHYGLEFLTFPPLFGHQYSHLWVDFRGIQDHYMRVRGIDYFENSVRATRANRAYAIANPMGFINYGPDEWGLTASDIPGGYIARGAPPPWNDDGTLAPTAPGGSFAFTPDLSLQALRAMYDRHRTRLWGPYGFLDAYNVTQDWVATDHLGIDQGPFVIMMENHATEAVWNAFMRNEHIQRGLSRAGFRPTDVSIEQPDVASDPSLALYPNPASGTFRLSYQGPPGDSRIEVFDMLGRRVKNLDMGAGDGPVNVATDGWAPGVYFVRLTSTDGVMLRSLVVF